MSDMTHIDRDIRPDGIDQRLTRFGAGDARARAFLAVIAKGREEVPPSRFDLIDYDTVDVALLPYLVRARSLQDFMFDGITEEIVRLFLKNAPQLHAQKGTVKGIRFGLSLLKMRVRWTHWFNAVPQAAPNTYTATAYLDGDLLNEGATLSPRTRGAATTMVAVMKRHSQEGQLTFGIDAHAPVKMGATARLGGLIHTKIATVPNQTERAPVRMGATARLGGLIHTRGLAA